MYIHKPHFTYLSIRLFVCVDVSVLRMICYIWHHYTLIVTDSRACSTGESLIIIGIGPIFVNDSSPRVSCSQFLLDTHDGNTLNGLPQKITLYRIV